MKRVIVRERLGDISTELLLQNLNNYNPNVSSIDQIRLAVSGGFFVLAEIEREAFESDGELEDWVKRLSATPEKERFAAMRKLLNPPGKLQRLVLEIRRPAAKLELRPLEDARLF